MSHRAVSSRRSSSPSEARMRTSGSTRTTLGSASQARVRKKDQRQRRAAAHEVVEPLAAPPEREAGGERDHPQHAEQPPVARERQRIADQPGDGGVREAAGHEEVRVGPAPGSAPSASRAPRRGRPRRRRPSRANDGGVPQRLPPALARRARRARPAPPAAASAWCRRPGRAARPSSPTGRATRAPAPPPRAGRRSRRSAPRRRRRGGSSGLKSRKTQALRQVAGEAPACRSAAATR